MWRHQCNSNTSDIHTSSAIRTKTANITCLFRTMSPAEDHEFAHGELSQLSPKISHGPFLSARQNRASAKQSPLKMFLKEESFDGQEMAKIEMRKKGFVTFSANVQKEPVPFQNKKAFSVDIISSKNTGICLHSIFKRFFFSKSQGFLCICLIMYQSSFCLFLQLLKS